MQDLSRLEKKARQNEYQGKLALVRYAPGHYFVSIAGSVWEAVREGGDWYMYGFDRDPVGPLQNLDAVRFRAQAMRENETEKEVEAMMGKNMRLATLYGEERDTCQKLHTGRTHEDAKERIEVARYWMHFYVMKASVVPAGAERMDWKRSAVRKLAEIDALIRAPKRR